MLATLPAAILDILMSEFSPLNEYCFNTKHHLFGFKVYKMPRTYRRPVGARKYKDYTDENLAKAADAVRNFEEPLPKNTFKKAVKTTVTMQDLTGSTDIYVIVELVFDEGKKKESVKQFYAKVVETSPEKHEVSVKFLRQSVKSDGNVYVFPHVDDEMDVNISTIVSTVQPLDVKRGRHTFLYQLD